MARLIKEIAQEIKEKWPKVHPWAKPYLNAMLTLETIQDHYWLDSAEDIVIRFLCNAQSFKGEDARRLKKELKSLMQS